MGRSLSDREERHTQVVCLLIGRSGGAEEQLALEAARDVFRHLRKVSVRVSCLPPFRAKTGQGESPKKKTVAIVSLTFQIFDPDTIFAGTPVSDLWREHFRWVNFSVPRCRAVVHLSV